MVVIAIITLCNFCCLCPATKIDPLQKQVNQILEMIGGTALEFKGILNKRYLSNACKPKCKIGYINMVSFMFTGFDIISNLDIFCSYNQQRKIQISAQP